MIKMWKFIGSARSSALPFLHTRIILICWSLFYHNTAPLNLTSIMALVWSFSLNYILSIVLSAAQLAISSYIQSSKIAMLIDSAKVVINIASALRVTTSSTKHLIDLPMSSTLLGKAEDIARDMLKVIPVPPPVAFPDNSIKATVSLSAHENADSRSPGRAGYEESIPKMSMIVEPSAAAASAHTLRFNGIKRRRCGQTDMGE